jgi:hypothetical protein
MYLKVCSNTGAGYFELNEKDAKEVSKTECNDRYVINYMNSQAEVLTLVPMLIPRFKLIVNVSRKLTILETCDFSLLPKVSTSTTHYILNCS